MIISHKHKFIFIKTEKTAGTSMEIALSKYCGENDIVTPLGKKSEVIRTELGYTGPQNFQIPFSKYSLKDWLMFIYNRKRKVYYNHISAGEVKKYISDEVWNTYYKFCFERNPYDKVVSGYFFFGKEFTSIYDYIQSGNVQKRGQPMRELGVGQSDYTAPAVVHWHGAGPDQALVQISAGFGGAAKWFDEVSPGDYAGKR